MCCFSSLYNKYNSELFFLKKKLHIDTWTWKGIPELEIKEHLLNLDKYVK